MILIRMKNGDLFTYGKEVRSWNTFKGGKDIASLMLTDGEGFNKLLSGYDYYSIEIEAISAISFSTGQSNTQVTKETIFGIFDLSDQKNKLMEVFNNKLKQHIETGADVKTLEKTRASYEQLLSTIEQREVDCFTLLIEENSGPKSNFYLPDVVLKGEKKNILSTEELMGKAWQRKL